MSSLLEGQTLVWLSWDELGVFTAATRQMLNDQLADTAVNLQVIRPASPDELTLYVQRQPTSLVTFTINQHGDLATACKAFARIRGRIDQPVCVAFLAMELTENIALLMEAGAQVVLSQLPSWQRALTKVIATAPLAKQGFHPLTSGLIDRLPL